MSEVEKYYIVKVCSSAKSADKVARAYALRNKGQFVKRPRPRVRFEKVEVLFVPVQNIEMLRGLEYSDWGWGDIKVELDYGIYNALEANKRGPVLPKELAHL